MDTKRALFFILTLTAAYERLSRNDLLQGESLSIANQKQILETYAEQNGYTPFLHLTDDGYTGTQWARPADRYDYRPAHPMRSG